MAKFKFEMANILSLKENIATQKEQEFGKAVQALAAEQHKLETMHEEMRTCMAKLRGEMGGGIKPNEISQMHAYMELLKMRIEDQKKVILTAEKFVEFKRHELIEATKEKQMLEKLRDKKREEYLEEEKAAEQKSVDELVSYKYSPSKRAV